MLHAPLQNSSIRQGESEALSPCRLDNGRGGLAKESFAPVLLQSQATLLAGEESNRIAE
jgi:hypothetical protein